MHTNPVTLTSTVRCSAQEDSLTVYNMEIQREGSLVVPRNCSIMRRFATQDSITALQARPSADSSSLTHASRAALVWLHRGPVSDTHLHCVPVSDTPARVHLAQQVSERILQSNTPIKHSCQIDNNNKL